MKREIKRGGALFGTKKLVFRDYVKSEYKFFKSDLSVYFYQWVA